jgi:hypothetical protein
MLHTTRSAAALLRPFFGSLDIRLAISESVDACQCCAESFLGDAERQLAFGALAG